MNKDTLVKYVRKYGKRDYDATYLVIDAVVGDTIVATQATVMMDNSTIKQEQTVFTQRANGVFFKKGDSIQKDEACGLFPVLDCDTECADIGYTITDKSQWSSRNKAAAFRVWRERKGDWNDYYERSIQARLRAYHDYLDTELQKDINRNEQSQARLQRWEQRYSDWLAGKDKETFYKDFGTRDDNRITDNIKWGLNDAKSNLVDDDKTREHYARLKQQHGVYNRDNYTLWN